jgi:hypothetical protein
MLDAEPSTLHIDMPERNRIVSHEQNGGLVTEDVFPDPYTLAKAYWESWENREIGYTHAQYPEVALPGMLQQHYGAHRAEAAWITEAARQTVCEEIRLGIK